MDAKNLVGLRQNTIHKNLKQKFFHRDCLPTKTIILKTQSGFDIHQIYYKDFFG